MNWLHWLLGRVFEEDRESKLLEFASLAALLMLLCLLLGSSIGKGALEYFRLLETTQPPNTSRGP